MSSATSTIAAQRLAQQLALRPPRQPLLMGVLNVTPDSFFDGGQYRSASGIHRRIQELLERGADIIDVGAESSRPGAQAVPSDEQIARLGPALQALGKTDVTVSVDTTDPRVAAFAVQHGAAIINDVSCLRDDTLARVAAEGGAWLVLSHSRTTMSAMSGFSQWPDDDYGDIVADVVAEWGEAATRAEAQGMARSRIIVDPGLGFAKNARHSLELLRRTDELAKAGWPLLVGPGRKSFIAAVDPSSPAERLGGTIASSLHAARSGAAILRVHDVRDVRQALRIETALSSQPDAE